MGLIHPETHFTDEKAGMLREATYRRLRRHWQFINELVLFEIDHHVSFGVHVYGHDDEPGFVQASSLYSPDTAIRSLHQHDGSGVEPGLKDENGNWDLRPHASRIQHVTPDTLATWHAILENDDVPVDRTRMVYTVNRSTAAVLAKLATAPRIGDLGLQFSAGWNETTDRAKGYFDVEWGVPESWDQVILQGPHIHVANPFYKSPNPTMKNNQDWTPVDLEALPPDAIPVTAYKPRGDRARYEVSYTYWDDDEYAARDFYRLTWRTMAANTGERTLIPAIIPPGAAHIHRMSSVGLVGDAYALLPVGLAYLSSLLSDLLVRVVPKSDVLLGTVARLPLVQAFSLVHELEARALGLVCTTAVYERLWVAHRTDPWAPKRGIRRAADRRRAQVEIDALVALSLGVTADELCTIYRTQFPVLYGYDHDEYLYDAVGRLVPTPIRQTWKRLCEPTVPDAMPAVDRTAVHPGSGITYTYELPFRHLDREADMRAAYDRFRTQFEAGVAG